MNKKTKKKTTKKKVVKKKVVKKLTKAEKMVKALSEYMMTNFSYDIIEGGVDKTIITLLDKIKRQNSKWTTKEGRVLKFDPITDSHLTNIIKHLEERARVDAARLSVKDDDESIMLNWKDHLPLVYSLLLQERDRRETEEIMRSVKTFNAVIKYNVEGGVSVDTETLDL